MTREGIVHHGIELQFEGERHRIDFDELTGKGIVIYGQTEVVKDLIAARLASQLPLLFEVSDVVGRRPRLRAVDPLHARGPGRDARVRPDRRLRRLPRRLPAVASPPAC